MGSGAVIELISTSQRMIRTAKSSGGGGRRRSATVWDTKNLNIFTFQMELVGNFSISGISNLMGVTNEEPATMATAAQVIMSHLVHDITILSP